MFGNVDWFRGDRSTLRTRLVMIGAVVGALLVLATSVAFSWPVTIGDTPPPDEATLAFNSPPGTCLTWTNPTGANMRRVPCTAPHLFEVAGAVDISADYGPDAPTPDLAAWQKIKTDRCTPSVTSYLGGKLDPMGKFMVDALKPTDAQWRAGDRKVRCGIQRAAPSGSRLPTTGSAAGQDQSDVYDPGTCIALNGKSLGDPVRCDDAHAYEVVAVVDLGSVFTGGYPSEQQQRQKLIPGLCEKASKSYIGKADLKGLHLSLYAGTLGEQSWAAGSRRVNCNVASIGRDGKSLRSIAGSVHGGR